MQVTKTLIIFISLIEMSFCENLIETPETHKSVILDATLNIINKCAVGRLDTIGIGGESAGLISGRLSTQQTFITLVITNSSSVIRHNDFVPLQLRHKLQGFVITATNSSSLLRAMVKLRSTIWWNHMAFYLIFDPLSSDCSKALDITWEASWINLLRVGFLCLDQTRGLLIYTYNPFNSFAPAPWRVEKTYIGLNNHSWTLLVQSYRENFVCKSLDYDKTLNLNGYQIVGSAVGLKTLWRNDDDRRYLFGRLNQISAELLISALNASVKFLRHSRKDIGYMDEAGKTFGMVAEVFNGTSDIAFIVRNQFSIRNWPTIYPHLMCNLVAMTQFSSQKSQLDKIITIFDIETRFGLLAICLTILVFLTCCAKKSFVLSMLDVILVIVNNTLDKMPTKLAPRMYLACLFLVVTTIQGIFQGRLASLLTAKLSFPNTDSIEDLFEGRYTVHTHTVYARFFDKAMFEGRVFASQSYNCTNETISDPKVACVGLSIVLKEDAALHRLHLSNEAVATIQIGYIIRPDWPLEDRVMTILMRTFEADLITSKFNVEIRTTSHMLETYENEYKNNEFKVISLNQLRFVFVFLGGFLGLAFVIFLLEVATDSRVFRFLVNKFGMRIHRVRFKLKQKLRQFFVRSK